MQKSYLITFSCLILHQIDAAFWHEWDLFLLPGGIQGFLIFNLLLIPILLIGYKDVVLESPHSIKYSTLCASLGGLTFLIHSTFLLMGNEQFQLPLSLIIIACCALSSVWQVRQIMLYEKANYKA